MKTSLPLTAFILGVLIILLGCEPQSKSLKGVYYMRDVDKMARFVNHPGPAEFRYCLSFNPGRELTTVRFLSGPEVYSLVVKKEANDEFLFTSNLGTRKAKVVPDYSSISGWRVFFYFEDSCPYSEEAKHKNIPYDGGKDPSWKTLDDCVQAQLKHLKEAEEQSYPSPEKIEGNVAH